MRTIRLLVAAGAAVCALAAPAAAQAVPQGHLSEAEYAALVAVTEQGRSLGEDPTPAEARAMCAPLASRATRLLAAEYAACNGTARWLEKLTSLGACKDDRCYVLRAVKAERATRELASLLGAERRAVAARGLSGACLRAFDNRGLTDWLGTTADALRDMRRAMQSGDAAALERALKRWDAAFERTSGPSDAQGLALLKRCPRA